MIPIPGPSSAGSDTITIICSAPSGGSGFAGGGQQDAGGPGGLSIATFLKSDLTSPLAVLPGQGGRRATGDASPGGATDNGYGAAGAGLLLNAGGGGAEFAGVFNNNTVNQANALLIASGGSGAPSQNANGAPGGGIPGRTGDVGLGTNGGVGGSSSAGGAGGPGADGTALTGGTGAGGNSRGGGGGSGGYWGGEGGAGSTGGCGSSFASALAINDYSARTCHQTGGGKAAAPVDENGADGEISIRDNRSGVATIYTYTGSAQTYNIV